MRKSNWIISQGWNFKMPETTTEKPPLSYGLVVKTLWVNQFPRWRFVWHMTCNAKVDALKLTASSPTEKLSNGLEDDWQLIFGEQFVQAMSSGAQNCLLLAFREGSYTLKCVNWGLGSKQNMPPWKWRKSEPLKKGDHFTHSLKRSHLSSSEEKPWSLVMGWP